MRDVMLIIHFIGLAMGLGTGFAHLFLGIVQSKMDKNEGQKFVLNTLVLTRMGSFGLVLLVLSGGYLMTPYWAVLSETPLLIVKLVLVLVLGALVGMISSKGKKAKAGNTESHLNTIELLGKFTLLTAIVIVVLAVLVFH